MTHPLYAILERLDARKLWYSLHRTQHDQVMIAITLVGQRIEVYVSSAGAITFSRFIGTPDVRTDLAGSEHVGDDAGALFDLIDHFPA